MPLTRVQIDGLFGLAPEAFVWAAGIEDTSIPQAARISVVVSVDVRVCPLALLLSVASVGGRHASVTLA